MLTCNKIMSTSEITMSTCDFVNIIILLVDINKSHVDIIMWHVDMICLACRWQKYVIELSPEKIQLYLNTMFKEITRKSSRDLPIVPKSKLGHRSSA